MKKYLSLLVVFVCVVAFMTGCGSSKTLTCTKSEVEDSMNVNSSIKVSFDENNIAKRAVGTMEMKVPDEYLKLASINDLANMLTEEFADYNNKGMKVDTKTSGNTIIVTMDMNVDDLSSDLKDEYNLTDSSYDSVKASFESDGYTCK